MIENNDTLQQTLTLANMLVQNNEFDSALEVLDFCESTIVEVMGTDNLDYGMCELYRGVIAYTRSQPQIERVSFLIMVYIIVTFTLYFVYLFCFFLAFLAC